MSQIYSKNAKDEIAMHKKLEHPNIIRLLNYYFEKDRNVTYMVLEYADGGSLFDKIKASIMPKAFVRRVFQQACGAIMTLHKNGVMHRDIKVHPPLIQPENILLTKKGDAKLCDFGFAAILGERKTLCGTY
jgi:serine/threonine protein kinase